MVRTKFRPPKLKHLLVAIILAYATLRGIALLSHAMPGQFWVLSQWVPHMAGIKFLGDRLPL